MQQPGMPPFSPASGTPPPAQHAPTAAAPSPISSRGPPEGQQNQQVVDAEHEHEGMMMMSAAAGSDEAGERGGGPSGGNRWPRQETLALLKIRSEMDAAFREAALKGPLWDQVSRRLEAMGYKRSAKKCREKFENVDKYYKRTKDGRAGRGDGKAYRFFSELEALHGGSASSSSPAPASLAATPVAMAPPAQPLPVMGGAPGSMVVPAMHVEQAPRHVAAVPQPAPQSTAVAAATTGSDVACMMTSPGGGDLSSFSSGSSDGEDTAEETAGGNKRKRHGEDGGGSSSKMMRFFEGLMRQVMERQEEMQQRFMEALEQREQERMIREEAWRRQEVARLAREQDALAQERAMAASRDAAVVSFIQRVTGQTIPMPMPMPSFISAAALTTQPAPLQPTPVASAGPAPSVIQVSSSPKLQLHTTMPTNKPAAAQPPPTQAQAQNNKQELIVRAPAAESQQQHDNTTGAAASPSRWPKAEVHALIQLRTELEARYQDSGPKGPLWEDISAGMRRLGYSRSAKRCKEKWENINKYFKKVKESNKKRPEDSKTCPYYHQLEALYRTKAAASSVVVAGAPQVLAPVPLSQTPPHADHGNGCASDNTNGGTQAPTRLSVVQGTTGGNGVAANKQQAEGGIATTKQETAAATEPTRPQPVSMNDSYVNDNLDSDSSMDDDDEDDFDDDDDAAGGDGSSKMQYEIQFQRQHQQQSQSSGGVRPNASGAAGSGPSGPGPAATSGSLLTMVHH